MKLFVKRALFMIWIVIAAATVAAIPIGLAFLLSGHEIRVSTEWRIAYTFLILATSVLLVLFVVRRRQAKGFSSLAPVLTSVMCEYAVLPIDRVSTIQTGKLYAANVDGLYFYRTDAVTDEVAANAARVLAPLRQYLEERTQLSDYSDSETTFQIKRVKKAPIWALKISMNDGSIRLKYYYSPEGCTDALRNVLFFPPRQVAPQWFI